MSIKFHLYLGGVLSAVVFMFVLCGLYFFLKVEVGLFLPFLAGVLAAYIPILLFRYWLHARCPKCGGTARQQPGVLIGKDIRYACSSCGYTQQTGAAYRSDSPPSY